MVDPRTLKWVEGPLPPVEEVPYDHVVILFEKTGYIGVVCPWGNELNPLRWVGSNGFPYWGNSSPEGIWAVVLQGSDKRPTHVKTWKEYMSELNEVKNRTTISPESPSEDGSGEKDP